MPADGLPLPCQERNPQGQQSDYTWFGDHCDTKTPSWFSIHGSLPPGAARAVMRPASEGAEPGRLIAAGVTKAANGSQSRTLRRHRRGLVTIKTGQRVAIIHHAEAANARLSPTDGFPSAFDLSGIFGHEVAEGFFVQCEFFNFVLHSYAFLLVRFLLAG